MPLELYDRVKQKSTTAGTGNVTLTSSVATFLDFSSVYSDNQSLFYTIENLTDFEVGYGTYSGNTISRNIVFKSSNNDNLVNLSGDSNTFVFVTYPASGAVHTTGDRIVYNVDGVDFNPIANGSQPSHQEGRIFYDLDNHALAVYNDESEITLQVGQEEYLRVRNNTTGTIFNGEAVRIIGSQGTRPIIDKAIATNDIDAQAIGLATHDIEQNSFGYVTTYGVVNNVDTSAFSSGQEIFLSYAISGGLTGVSPIAPNFKLSMGHVLRSHPNVGNILVKPSTPKLGGGDVKSLGNFQESGIAFIDLVAGSNAAIISSNTGLSYNSGTNTLQVDAGGVRFPDGVTQTIAYTGQDSTYTASDGISLNGNNFILNGTGSLDKLTITSGIVFPDGNTQTIAYTGQGDDWPPEVVTSGTAAITLSCEKHANKYLRSTNALAVIVTVPSGLGCEPSTEFKIEQAGLGLITVSAAAGVTIESRGGLLSLAGQYGVVTLKQVGTDTYTLYGDLA